MENKRKERYMEAKFDNMCQGVVFTSPSNSRCVLICLLKSTEATDCLQNR